MSYRIPESLNRLAGQGPTRGIGNGTGNHHWHTPAKLGEYIVDGHQGCLTVQGVKNGFNHQDICTALE